MGNADKCISKKDILHSGYHFGDRRCAQQQKGTFFCPVRNTVGREQKVCRVLAPAPLDLVDLFLDLQTLQVVKLGLVRLELGVKLVLASFFLEKGWESGS